MDLSKKCKGFFTFHSEGMSKSLFKKRIFIGEFSGYYLRFFHKRQIGQKTIFIIFFPLTSMKYLKLKGGLLHSLSIAKTKNFLNFSSRSNAMNTID